MRVAHDVDADRGALRARIGLLIAVLCGSGLAHADCEPQVASHARWYSERELQPRTYVSLGSISAEVTCGYRHEAHALGAKIFGRWAQHDSARSYFDIRELQWTVTREPVQVRAGVDQVFWGVMEFAHIVDIVNQSDMLDDALGDVKLGQPMISVSVRQPWGTVAVFGMPRFRDRVYPDYREPLRSAPGADIGAAQFESKRGRNHFDAALRYNHTQGPVDLGLSYFRGTNRDPDYRTTLGEGGRPLLRSYYGIIEQYGIDLQLTADEWLFKVEAARRNDDAAGATAYAFGIERTISGVAGTVADLILAAEYLRDRRDPLPVPGFMDDDWIVGARLTLNDVRSTEARLGIIFDANKGSRILNLEVSTRLAQQWRLASEARLFKPIARRDPLYVLEPDSFFDISLTRYF